MTNEKNKYNLPGIIIFRLSFVAFCLAAVFASAGMTSAKDSALTNEYIDIDNIVPGSDAWCLTVFEGTRIDKFNLKVVDIIKNHEPGQDVIIVIGVDEGFKRIGPIKGCSGSPVYIDGKLAGALAGGWSFSREPLYVVTPIKDILRIKEQSMKNNKTAQTSALGGYDFSKPIDLAEVNLACRNYAGSSDEPERTMLPLITSFPSNVCSKIAPLFEKASMLPVSAQASSAQKLNVAIEPGSVLAVPVVSGDITMAAVGTATHVNGNDVYGFGHSFQGMGFGPVDLPMSAGTVHAIVSSMLISFKVSSPGEIIGSITANESTGVYGQIGKKPTLIPLKISVDRGGADYPGMKDTYNCQIATERYLTPLVTQAAIAGVCFLQGQLPPEHLIKYKTNIRLEDGRQIDFENISSEQDIGELLDDTAGPVSLLLNNPYEKVVIASIDCSIAIIPKTILSRITSVELSDSNVKPGQSVTASIVLESFRSEKTLHRLKLKIPEDTQPEEYAVTIAGGYAYERFLKMSAPHKFTAYDMDSMIVSLNNITNIKRNCLYMVMPLSSSGIVIKNEQMPFLPQTKAMVLSDQKRTISVMPQRHWLQEQKIIDNVIINKKTVSITVEEK